MKLRNLKFVTLERAFNIYRGNSFLDGLHNVAQQVSTVLCVYKVVALEGAFGIFCFLLIVFFMFFSCHHCGFLMYFHWLQSETTPINATKSHAGPRSTRACSYKRLQVQPALKNYGDQSMLLEGFYIWAKTEFYKLGFMNLLSP